MKSVLAVHDISCVGRCSLTVALPVISSFGVTCAVLPTALLSTHTGGFSGFTYMDLTDEMSRIIDSWQAMGIEFDVVYSGFLGSANQVDVVKRLALDYKSAVKVIDPVMGDDGALYKVFDTSFVDKMREVVCYADILVPNMTEAMLLAGEDYFEGPYTREFIASLIGRLHILGAEKVVLTGVYYDEGILGVAVSAGGEVEFIGRRRIEGSYHGTGDVFGSVLSACVARGDSLQTASERAVEFVVDSILCTPKDKDKRFGVDFESVIYKGR